ncbi:MAG TPA: hydrogenase expression protein HypE [Acetobacteraceae bacterium]|nr:hydrogenase expression protein HypE [Acetobacteraceae bacterium]
MSGPAGALIRAGQAVPAQPWPRRVLEPAAWRDLAAALPKEPELALVALWADTANIHALFHDEAEPAMLLASTPVESGAYAALSPARPAAAWFERMIRDLWGHEAAGGVDARPWLDHGHWPASAPLSARPGPVAGAPPQPVFLPAEGESLHQIPVGPVHAGIIEPGHFRLTVQGETVVRLEVRLGYTHKGQLALMRGKSPRIAARYAARLSGDSTVAHAIGFARAAEAASLAEPPPRAAALRAVMAEIERIANHAGDVGAICNDAAFAFLHARFGLHREALLRAAAAAFGHRLMMDCVVPGGVAADIAEAGAGAILRALDALEKELPDLARVYEDYASLVDRMLGTGVTQPALVLLLGAGGVVGRAAGRAGDVRVFPGYPPYDTVKPVVAVRDGGDVDARVRVRLAEIAASAALVRQLLGGLPDGAVSAPLPAVSGEGLGWAEGFRGPVWHWLRLDGGQIAAVFAADPSWLHWPLVEAAAQGNIVADFPLINKSINASYSGVDL